MQSEDQGIFYLVKLFDDADLKGDGVVDADELRWAFLAVGKKVPWRLLDVWIYQQSGCRKYELTRTEFLKSISEVLCSESPSWPPFKDLCSPEGRRLLDCALVRRRVTSDVSLLPGGQEIVTNVEEGPQNIAPEEQSRNKSPSGLSKRLFKPIRLLRSCVTEDTKTVTEPQNVGQATKCASSDMRRSSSVSELPACHFAPLEMPRYKSNRRAAGVHGRSRSQSSTKSEQLSMLCNLPKPQGIRASSETSPAQQLPKRRSVVDLTSSVDI
mmetsp:Transcript_14792/g.35227  ORF Transcript_14792/g.35227 Transcript_14792/m.35227 type:complete len:269 (-) Transcript_14792:192-998(-)